MANDRRLPLHPGLDGLRGLAVLAVLLYHAGVSWAPGGYLGVSVFFTLSGFLITSLLIEEHAATGGVSLRAFWARRLRRLLPAATAALTGVCVFGVTVASMDQRRGLDGDVVAALAHVANWRFVLEDVAYGEVFGAPSPVLHFWSLAIEAQFYLVVPVLVVGLLSARRGALGLLAVVVAGLLALSLSASFLLHDSGQDRVYFGTDTRAAELLSGSILAIAVAARRRTGPALPPRLRSVAATGTGLVGLVVLGLAVTTVPQDAGWLYSGGFAAVSLASVAAIVGTARHGALGAVLGNPLLRWAGLRSYGIYLYHWPIFLWLDAPTTGLEDAPLLVLRSVVTVVAAEASYHLVEARFRARRSSPRAVRALAPLSSATLAVAAIGLAVTAPEPEFQFRETVVRQPATPPEEDARLVVLGGDLASDLAGELAASPRPGVAVIDRTRPECGATATSAARVRSCSDVESDWTTAVDDAETVVVLVGPGDPLSGDADALRRVRRAIAPGTRVVWVTHPIVGPWAHPDPAVGPPAAFGVPAGAETVAAADTTAALVGDLATESGDRLVELARLVEPPPAGDPPRRVPVVLSGDEPQLAHAMEQVVTEVLDGVRSTPGTVRILLVGDSIGQTIGNGMTEWAERTGRAVVWNATRAGCGLLREGDVPLFGTVAERCDDWEADFTRYVAEFDPDLVVVHSGPWDIARRRLDGVEGYSTPGDPELDAYIRSEYRTALDVLGGRGAPVLWLSTPCFAPELGDLSDVFDPERRAVQDGILAELQVERPRLEVYDLEELVCPGGEYQNVLGGFEGARTHDGVHFSTDAAVWISEQIAPTISELTGADLANG